MSGKQIKIQEFEDKNDPSSRWRLNWIGSVERDPKVATEYKIQITLVKLKSGLNTGLHHDSAVAADEPRRVKVGVGQLPLLKVGSVWQDGCLSMDATGEIRDIYVDIPTEPFKNYSPIDKINGDERLIPFSQHRVGSTGAKSNCVVLPFRGNPTGLVIPVVELIRFYYASSSDLAKAIFNGDFIHNPKKMYNPEFTGMDENIAVVHRRQNFSDHDCWTIARILNSRQAGYGAALVSDSLTRSFSNTGWAHPESRFPFVGRSRLQAYCKRIGYNQSRLLILSLISCSAQFPFNELKVFADNNADKADPSTDKSDEEKRMINRGGSDIGTDEEIITIQSDDEVDKTVPIKRVDVPGQCFEALRGKDILKEEKKECRYKSGQLKNKTDALAGVFGTADGDYTGTKVGSAKLEQTETHSLLPSYATLVDLVDELNTRKEVIEAKLPQLKSGLLPGLVKVRRTRRRGEAQWSYLDRARFQLRHLMVAEIVTKSGCFYLFEIERRNPADTYLAEIFHGANRGQLSAHELDQISIEIVKASGRVKNIKFLPNEFFRVGYGLKHTWENVAECAEIVLCAIGKTR